MVNGDVVGRKLARMQEYLGELAELTTCSFQDYRSDYKVRHAAERLIELVVEAAIDINTLVVSELRKRPPTDYYSSFIEMGELQVLPAKLANTTLHPFAVPIR